jgi:hypothetical protein
MKTYLRNEIIYNKNAHINQVFKIVKGHITNASKTMLYKPKDYLFLDQIFYNAISTDDYYALDLVVGEWMNKDEITMDYFPILSKMYQEKKNQTELLLLKDPITKISRYLYFEFINNQSTSYYLTMSLKDLSFYLNLSLKLLSESLKFLESREVIAKHNKLFNILQIKKLEEYAYLPDLI